MNSEKLQHGDVKRHYDTGVSKETSYEYSRWFSSPARKAGYDMQKDFLEKYIKRENPKFSSYLEVGPGPGTWTKIFFNYRDDAQYTLVELSDEMSKKLKEEFARQGHVTVHTTDFMEFDFEKKYDFFFSSRALEYFEDKEAFVEKVFSLLSSGSSGLIITKTPHYKRLHLTGRTPSPLHAGQIDDRELASLLKKAGFYEVQIYPVSFVFPILNISFLNNLLNTIFSPFKMNAISCFFSESYAVSFKKR